MLLVACIRYGFNIIHSIVVLLGDSSYCLDNDDFIPDSECQM